MRTELSNDRTAATVVDYRARYAPYVGFWIRSSSNNARGVFIMAIGNPGTKIAGNFSQLGEENKGKGTLDPQQEYTFELVSAEDKLIKAWQSAEDKAANKPAGKKHNAATTWRELTTGIQVFQKFNIETLSWGNGPTDSKRSKVIKFLEDIGIQVPKDKVPVWDNAFIPTMKIRARIVPATNPDEYFFKEGSFRKYQV